MKLLPKFEIPDHPFVGNKYTQWYYSIIESAKLRNKYLGYVEAHHIIPESFYANRTRKGPAGWLPGDPNDPTNIVKLTAREHCIVHLLLVKMTSGIARQKCANAAWRMCSQLINGKRYKINSQLYSFLKHEFITWNKEKEISTESRQKMSNAKKGKSPSNKGKPHLEETKEKIRKARANQAPISEESRLARNDKLRNPTAETLEKMRQASVGRVVLQETREKISQSKLGKTHTEESKEKIRKARAEQIISAESYIKAANKRKGQKRSQETIDKMKKAQANRQPISEETRRKMSESAKRRAARDNQ